MKLPRDLSDTEIKDDHADDLLKPVPDERCE